MGKPLPIAAKLVATVNTGVTPAALALTPDGRFAYVANNNNYGMTGEDSVTVVDLTNFTVLTTINNTSFNQPYTITIDKQGQFAYATNSNFQNVTVIDVATNDVIEVIAGFDGPSGFAISADGGTAYVNNYGAPGGAQSGNGQTVSVVNLNSRLVTGKISVGLAPAALTMSPDGKYCYVINYGKGIFNDGSISVIDTATNTVARTIAGIGLFGPFGIAVLNDGGANIGYITNFGSNNFVPVGRHVLAVNLDSGQVLSTIPVGIQPSGVAISADGAFACVTNYNTLYSDITNFTGLTVGQGTVNIIDLSTNRLLPLTIPVGQSPSAIALSVDARHAYVTNYSSNTLSVIELTFA